MTDSSLKIELNTLPKNLRNEVADFIDFLKKKYKITAKISNREFGFAKGKIVLSNDFDEPLDEFNNYM